MKQRFALSLAALGVLFVACTESPTATAAAVSDAGPKKLIKTGTIDEGLCETSPFVFKDKQYRLEWHRKARRLRIMDPETQTEVSHFGAKHRFPSVIVEGDTVYVIGTTEDRGWCGTTLKVFTSKDLVNWEEHEGYRNPKFSICNTSACKAGDRYVMSIELVAGGGGYYGRFLESKDLLHWELMPEDCTLRGKGSVHLIRYHKDQFYTFATQSGQPVMTPQGRKSGFTLLLQRSPNLKKWESSPLNPVVAPDSVADKQIANPRLTEEQRAKIAAANDINNSDIDMCDYRGKLVVNYSWGNQTGVEFIAGAEFPGTTGEYLESLFPAPKPAEKKK